MSPIPIPTIRSPRSDRSPAFDRWRHLAALVLLSAGFTGPADAETVFCRVAEAELSFGTIDTASARAVPGTGRVELSCQNNSRAPQKRRASVSVGQGAGCVDAGTGVDARLMFRPRNGFVRSREEAVFHFDIALGAFSDRRFVLNFDALLVLDRQSPYGDLALTCPIDVSLSETD